MLWSTSNNKKTAFNLILMLSPIKNTVNSSSLNILFYILFNQQPEDQDSNEKIILPQEEFVNEELDRTRRQQNVSVQQR